jgi:hypothetical protein
MAGTTGLEPATSAVTAKRKVVTYRKQASRMASFGAVRYDREPLSNPYQTYDLCPVDLCPPSRIRWEKTLARPSPLRSVLQLLALGLDSSCRFCHDSSKDLAPCDCRVGRHLFEIDSQRRAIDHEHGAVAILGYSLRWSGGAAGGVRRCSAGSGSV